MAEPVVQITKGQNPLTDVERELWNIHQGIFGIMGMLRMVKTYTAAAEDSALAAADVVEVMDQYIPIVEDLRIRLDSAICRLK